MPAKHLDRISEEGAYCHIYNKGVEKRIIFNEDQDYKVFLGYLKDYLTTPPHPESTKKVFTVNGRTFRGIPHQSKNYFNKVELIAYSLMPDHFHLLLHQKTESSLESFIRSLSTRYSMYFNKKYHRSGSLFQGPYKSVQIKDLDLLLHLTRFIHHNKDLTNGYSSYSEYLGKRETSWVQPKVVLSLKGEEFDYKKFVEEQELEQERELLEGITFESEPEHLEGKVSAEKIAQAPADRVDSPKAPEVPAELPQETNPNQSWLHILRVPELVGVTAVFLLLVILGIRNINASATSFEPSPTPVASAVPTPSPKAEEKPKTTLVIKINDGAPSVNIRQNPTIASEKIGEAKDGEIFEFVSLNSGWYEVRLDNGSSAFISAAYGYLEGMNK